MNIAVCDDQLDYLNLISKKIYECFHEPELKLNVYTFSSIQEMLDSTRFRCYEFAFIEMKIENDRGIEAAMQLRKANRACQIVFISDKYYHIQEAFAVNAREYLLKPINTSQL